MTLKKTNLPSSMTAFFSKEQMLRDILIDHIPAQIFWKDFRLVYLGCNQAFLDSLGLKTKADVIGKTDLELPVSIKDSEAYRADDKEVIETKQPKLNIEERQTLKDGTERILSTSKVPLFDKKRNVYGVLAIYIDITDRKKMEEALRQSKLAAEAASKAKSDFIASMSHDIKIPLTGIIGTAKILERDTQDPQEKYHAQNILKCSNRLLELFIDILDNISADYANIDDLHLETFDIRQEITNLVELELLAVQFKNLELKTEIDKKIPQYVVADHLKLHRILLNLIGNAIKFTDKGYIEINIQLVSKTQDKVELKFSVKDTGVGIPENAKDKVFEKFFTVDPSYKGVHKGHGIGLNTAQSYTKLLGGSEVKLESKVGKGTTFYFVLPMGIGGVKDVKKSTVSAAETVEAAQKERDKIASTVQVTQPQIQILSANSDAAIGTVLLLEDDTICAEIAKDMLQKLNYSVVSVNNAESAFQLVKKEKYELIFTDVGLPGMSGDEFASLVRYWEKAFEKPHTPIIVLTAHANNPTERKKFISAGIDEILIKPTSIDAIKDAIHKFKPKIKHDDFKILTDEGSVDFDTFIVNQKPITGLGFELPETPAGLYQLEKYPICDFKLALEIFGNDESQVNKFLHDFLTKTLTEGIVEFKQAHKKNDWQQIKKFAHRMKGTAAYIAAMKMKYACQYLERYYLDGYRGKKELEKLYQQVLKIAEETKTYIGKYLIQKK